MKLQVGGCPEIGTTSSVFCRVSPYKQGVLHSYNPKVFQVVKLFRFQLEGASMSFFLNNYLRLISRFGGGHTTERQVGLLFRHGKVKSLSV